ncbi:MAG: ABC transporter [Desulfobulbaceae bacterium A2]|nr:MAG: ABC transporter [Desulfobulbaceae bacterium A2]
MGFLMDGLEAESYDRVYGDRELLGRILRYFQPHVPAMTLVAGTIVLTSVMQAVLPLALSWGLDRVAGDGSARLVGLLTAAILLAGALGWLSNAVRQFHSTRIVGDLVLTLRQEVFSAVMDRDLSFFDENPSGRIVSRVSSDSDDFATVVTLCLDLMSQLLLIGFILALLFSRNTMLALCTLAIAPVIVLVALSFRHLARQTITRAQRSRAQVNSTVQETMSGIAVAKNFRQEGTIYQEFRPINQQNCQVTLRAGIVFSAIFPLLFLIVGLATVLLIHIGGRAVLNGDLSAGSWYLFLQAIGLFWFPLTSIASFWSQFQRGLAAAERLFALMDAPPRVVQRAALPTGRLRGQIEFQDVSFAYDAKRPVFEHFSLGIAAGETVAVVGHTGAGKSSLARLIARAYEFSAGSILIDGHDIREIDLADYRRQLGLVPQQPFLFSGTIADNLRYPRPGASDAELLTAARHIGGGDWLESLPAGLATGVGEYGRALSLGQRQLVALARLLVQDPALVVLDEATASIDPLTERRIQESLDVVLRGRTAIVIAHRLSTVEHADRIIVLHQGRIVEEGDHRGLLARGGAYCQVYNNFFRHQSPDYRPGEGFVQVRKEG